MSSDLGKSRRAATRARIDLFFVSMNLRARLCSLLIIELKCSIYGFITVPQYNSCGVAHGIYT